MKFRTIKIWLSKGWYYAVYSVSLLLIPLITSCSSSRQSAKNSASKEATAADNKSNASPADSTVVTFDYRDPNSNLDLSRMRLMYGVQPPEISKDSIPLIVYDGNIIYVTAGQTSKFDFEKDITSKEKVAALLGLKPEEVKASKMSRDLSATAIWGRRGWNGVFEVVSEKKYNESLKGRKGSITYKDFQLLE